MSAPSAAGPRRSAARNGVSTWARTPPRPSVSAAGEPIAMVMPSGRISRLQLTSARFWPARRRSGTRRSAGCRAGSACGCRRSRARRARRSRGRGPGRVELSAVSSTAGMSVPWATVALRLAKAPARTRPPDGDASPPSRADTPPPSALTEMFARRRGRRRRAVVVSTTSAGPPVLRGGGGRLVDRLADRLRHVDDLRRGRRRRRGGGGGGGPGSARSPGPAPAPAAAGCRAAAAGRRSRPVGRACPHRRHALRGAPRFEHAEQDRAAEDRRDSEGEPRRPRARQRDDRPDARFLLVLGRRLPDPRIAGLRWNATGHDGLQLPPP